MTVSVIGAGAFGTALAISLAGKGPVTLWARNLRNMAEGRRNDLRLPGCPFPDALQVTDDLSLAAKADVILLAVPMQKLRNVLADAKADFAHKSLVACCKGIERSTGMGPVSVIAQEIATATPAILTGPSFAADIARGLPTALTLACADPDQGERLQHAVSTDNLRVYRTTDTVGAELGGAVKNVVAIGCGAVIGAGLGESARAALMTRGYAEMRRLAQHLGADPLTLSGLSGFGDLALTCTSPQSRNYRFGLALGTGEGFDKDITVEGAATARAMEKLARRHALDLPITSAITALLDGEIDVMAAMQHLLTRPLKEE